MTGPAAAVAPRERVVVAMSGGVDSSTAAARLVEQGYEVIGITMHLAGGASRCCSLEDAEDARRVAQRLGVRFFVANYRERFEQEVIVPFADSYLSGRTPIPCVACNTRFKFEYLMERARVFGAEKVATGHYARVERDPSSELYTLRRAADRSKDQTYFLFELGQAQLSRACFPLGAMTKSQVREHAREIGLTTADKPESQEICFVPDGDYAGLVERLRPEAGQLAGEIVDEAGRVLGRHAGIHHFTVGQRHGLGISAGRRLYVSRIEPDSQRVVVGGIEALAAHGAELTGVNWISGQPPERALQVRAQVRHRHAGVNARVEALPGGRARLLFDEPVEAVAPGQAAVFYDPPTAEAGREEGGERTLGGGWISTALK